ncbi:MAG: Rod shape-determining protein MreB [Chloroflexi bacterium]|nr:Rod shape-determining protein MreB [Chloroflexota bacterium]
MALFSQDIGIDIGTFHTMIAEGGALLIREPTVVAIAIDEQKIVELGQAAKDMYGRVPESLEIASPLRDGVIADYEIAEKLLEYMIKKVTGPIRFFHPRAMVSIPHGVTSVESRAVHEAVLEAGVREVFLIEQPLAAALGVDLPINTPTGNMIICLGGGASQAAVIAMYGVVAASTLRAGGVDLDEALITYVRRKYGLMIAQPTAERIKLEIGAATPPEEEKSISLQGQDQVSGLPQPFSLTSGEVIEAYQDPLKHIVENSRKVLEKTPPELVSDIIDRGIALCGGGALLPGIDKLLTKELGVPTYLVDNPTTCVVEGASLGLSAAIFPKIKRNLKT